MEYRGDARPSSGAIELNMNGHFDRQRQVICKVPVLLQDFGLFPNYNLSELSQQKHQVVIVEFDSYANYDRWDPPYKHVGININSPKSSVYTSSNASFHSGGDTADVWISYNASTKNLTVSWGYQVTSNPKENSILSFHVDLREILPMEWIQVGVGAATGLRDEIHTLKSWQFSSSLDSKDIKGSKADKIRMIVPMFCCSSNSWVCCDIFYNLGKE
ncbi:hypothetical protein PTKIN_Ptkin14bG0060400 [Pterospermum kingtungense]